MRLLLIRHAETTANVDRLLDTAPPGADLSDRGREQADALVEGLDDVELDAIYVSDLVRTQQTAAPLAGPRSLEPRIRPGVREIQAGDYEMAAASPVLPSTSRTATLSTSAERSPENGISPAMARSRSLRRLPSRR